MSENLNGIQIQLLLYFLEAEPKKRTVTDAARYLNKPKSTLTHILDSLDELALMERVEGRKSVLTAAGKRTAQQLLHQRKILEQYMQYQDIPPAQIKENALRALSAGFSDEFMERLAEQEGRMRLKEIFAGHRDFHGGDICNYLKDGSYYFPFIIYREQIKNHNNLSMANRGFENPCELIVKDHEGLVYLAVKTVSAESMSSGKKDGGPGQQDAVPVRRRVPGRRDRRAVCVFSGDGAELHRHGERPGHPAPRQRMPENAVQRGGYAYAGEHGDFHHVHPLKQGCQGQNKNFLNQVWYKCRFSVAMRLPGLFQAEKRRFEPGLVQKID